MTGSGMMDCKKALTESGGDFDGAIEILRKRGEKVAAKRGDRDANEGVIIAQTSADNTFGVIVRVSCETDFVSKNDDFVAFVQKIADIALAHKPANREALMALPMEGSLTVQDKVTEMVGKINEKIDVTEYQQLVGAVVAPYIHSGYRAGVLVSLSANSNDTFEAGRNIAMQVAAMSPVALDEDGVDQNIIEKEIEIGKELARQEGKPEEMIEKIALGKLNKFFKENTLVNQAYVKSASNESVAQYLNSVAKGLKAEAFKHVTLV